MLRDSGGQMVFSSASDIKDSTSPKFPKADQTRVLLLVCIVCC